MNPVYLKLIFALLIMLSTYIAGWYPFKKSAHLKDDSSLGETIATGVFLGAGLIHMLPESSEGFSELHYHYPFAYLITGLVFLLFLWFEHLCKELYHRDCKTNRHDHTQHLNSHEKHPAFAIFAWLMLSIHSLVLGAALGLSTDFAVLIMLFLAIIAHKWAESFSLAVQLKKSSMSMLKSKLFFLVFMLMTPIGIFIGSYLEQDIKTNSPIDPILMAISAGTFLYLGTLHGLDRCVMVQQCCNLKNFSFVIIGFLLMSLVAGFI